MIEEIQNEQLFEKVTSGENVAVIHFFADWAEQCSDVNDILEIHSKFPTVQKANVTFHRVNAEKQSQIALDNKITSVPTVLLIKNKTEVARVNGVLPDEITEKIKEHAAIEIDITSETLQKTDTNDLNSRLKNVINKHNLMIFMKGDRNQPRCGFSKQLIAILEETGVDYETFDILQNEEVRQGLKTYSDWPTYPQVYVKGELIGGLDIVKEMQSSGELISALKAE